MASRALTDREIGWLLRDKYPGFFASRRWRSGYQDLLADVARLRRGEPLAYVIGWVPFLGAHIDLREQTLIPRPETEFWVEHVLKEFGEARGSGPFRCLDLFAGSGCIGIAASLAFPKAQVTFADIDPKALRQVRFNLRQNRIPREKAKFARSDVFGSVKGRFELIFANPPYVPRGRELPSEVVRFEPVRALRSGKDGLAAIRKFMRGLPDRLAPDGRAYLEFDRSQGPMVKMLARRAGLRARIRRDQFGRIRWAELRPQRSVAGP